MMKQISKFIVSAVIAGFVAYIFRAPIQSRMEIIWNNIKPASAPCSKPINYSLGAFDAKFGLTKESFLDALREAEAVWEKPIGRDLFVYSPDGDLEINLIYDYRQEATGKLKSLGLAVDANRASYDTLNAKYIELDAQYKQAKADYDNLVEAFNARNDAYGQQVEYWNRRGGAPKKEYAILKSEEEAIQADFAEIKNMEGEMNEYVDNIKAVVVVLNNIANALNIDVRKYNDIGNALGEEFNEGVYRNDGQGSEEIDIYEFGSRGQLVRILTHEFGHALGLPHVEDQDAIMYKLNVGKNTALSPSDIGELKIRCSIK
ncbi:MAG: matrixin family metalloprotease [Candidatus Paceibacterota bacterium]|jgi:hypothetical protein